MIYLHCSEFEQFGYDGRCCPHSGCHEDFFSPPRKPGGSKPLVSTTDCCHFDSAFRTRDNCAKLVRERRKLAFVRNAKQRVDDNLQKSAFRLADARLRTFGWSGSWANTSENAREEIDAVEQYREAIKAKEENNERSSRST